MKTIHALHAQATTLAAADGYGTTGLQSWLRENAITLIVLILGLAVLWAARGGNIAKGVTIIGGVVLGLAVLGLASGTNATDIADFIVGLLKSSS